MANHNNVLEVTVARCNNLKDTTTLTRQKPYVLVVYGDARKATLVSTDGGGRNPTFQETFKFSVVEGLRELKIKVRNSNNILHDNLIGHGRVNLTKVLSEGYDERSWSLQTKKRRGDRIDNANIAVSPRANEYSNTHTPQVPAITVGYPIPCPPHPTTNYNYFPHPNHPDGHHSASASAYYHHQPYSHA